MKYIAEVCAVLMDETERRYLKARDTLETLMGELDGVDTPSHKLAEQVDTATKDYHRAAKEYLSVAFKTKFLGQ